MTSWVALLRGINVGGNKMVGMQNLRFFFEAHGHLEVKSVLQSGNILFKSKLADHRALESKLETEAAHRFGLPIDFFVRDADAWQDLIARNPFPSEAVADPSHLLVMCCKSAPKPAALIALQDAIKDREYFKAAGREIYLAYPDGIGESRLTSKLIEAKLSLPGTGTQLEYGHEN